MKECKGYITKEQLLSALMHFQETTDKKIEYNAWRKFQKFVIGLEDDDFAYYYEAKGDVLFTIYKQNNESESIAGDKYLIDTLTSYGKSLESYNTCACATKYASDEITSCGTGSLGINYATSINWPPEYAITTNTIKDTTYNLAERLNDLEMKVKDTYVNDKKENKTMDICKSFNFGKLDNSNVRLSMYGIAVKNRAGDWVSYDTNTGDIVDVEVLSFNDKGFLYQMPVSIKNIALGDVIVHNKVPCFVTGFAEDTGNPIVIDVYVGERKEILPTKSPFGFNFLTRIVNLMEGAFVAKPNEDNPFGNMWMLALMGENGKMEDMLPFLMMNGGNFDTANPMLMYMLMKNGSADNILPYLFMMNGANK